MPKANCECGWFEEPSKIDRWKCKKQREGERKWTFRIWECVSYGNPSGLPET